MDRAMKPEPGLRFKIATEDWEFEAVHRLNYKTFVEEIPQHARNPDQRLVDKFHAENTYAICLHGDRLVGMVTGRGQRPFSLDQKLPQLESFLPAGHRVLEVRRAFERGPVSHRSDGFMADFRATKRMLCALTQAQQVEILLGSGSLANDTVCAQLALLHEPGLILSNGEFGDRLIDHATRQG